MVSPAYRPPRPGSAGPPDWETFPHGADVGVRGFGCSLADAFANAALALTSVVVDPTSVRSARAVSIRCAAPDDEVLLFDWLNGVVGRMATDGMLFGRFEVEIEGGRLSGWAYGEPVDPARHEPAVEVKGATFTCLEVGRAPDGRWRAQCIVDV